MNTTKTGAKTADVRLRLEPELKEQAVKILSDSGLDLSIAIRLFLKHVIAHGGLPFGVRQPNTATIRAMRQTIAKPRFSSAKELFDDLEKGPQGKRRNATQKKRREKGVPKRRGKSAAPGN